MQFRTFEIRSVAVNRPVSTGRRAKGVLVGVGEKFDALEPFHPDRAANRILGMGDILSFIEKASEQIDRRGDRHTVRDHSVILVRSDTRTETNPYAGRDGNRAGAILAAKSLKTRTGRGTKRLPR